MKAIEGRPVPLLKQRSRGEIIIVTTPGERIIWERFGVLGTLQLEQRTKSRLGSRWLQEKKGVMSSGQVETRAVTCEYVAR